MSKGLSGRLDAKVGGRGASANECSTFVSKEDELANKLPPPAVGMQTKLRPLVWGAGASSAGWRLATACVLWSWDIIWENRVTFTDLPPELAALAALGAGPPVVARTATYRAAAVAGILVLGAVGFVVAAGGAVAFLFRAGLCAALVHNRL